mmetsp:Transcript_79796/g.258537  ORF Transcript_79796/g.258537 Transcript_79796/m.258537 type:complete len:216 (+) Transcript_79796:1642-2289(+)
MGRARGRACARRGYPLHTRALVRHPERGRHWTIPLRCGPCVARRPERACLHELHEDEDLRPPRCSADDRGFAVAILQRHPPEQPGELFLRVRAHDGVYGLFLRLYGLHDPLQVGHAHAESAEHHQLPHRHGNVGGRLEPDAWRRAPEDLDGRQHAGGALHAHPEASDPTLAAQQGGGRAVFPWPRRHGRRQRPPRAGDRRGGVPTRLGRGRGRAV